MPIDWTQGATQPTSTRGLSWDTPDDAYADYPDTTETGSGSGLTPGLVAGGTLAGAGLLYGASKLKNLPGVAGKFGKLADLLNAARMQLMLSGLAVPKSLLGNLGAGVIESAERGTLAPLKALLSRETLRDARAAFKTAEQAGPAVAGSTTTALPTPGRIMGAFDVATRNALQRGGLTAQEAERAVLQSPLNKDLADAMDSPGARYLLPFRRTPFNQFTEGLKTMKPENLKAHPALNALIYGAGAAHGAMTADDPYPVSIGMGAAAASRYGLPYTLGAIAGRYYLGGNNNTAPLASAALPLSEYGLASGITNPLRPFTSPALLSLLEGR